MIDIINFFKIRSTLWRSYINYLLYFLSIWPKSMLSFRWTPKVWIHLYNDNVLQLEEDCINDKIYIYIIFITLKNSFIFWESLKGKLSLYIYLDCLNNRVNSIVWTQSTNGGDANYNVKGSASQLNKLVLKDSPHL